MQQMKDCICVCIYACFRPMHAWVFARNSKLLIVWRDEWISWDVFQYCVSIPNAGNWDEDCFCCSIWQHHQVSLSLSLFVIPPFLLDSPPRFIHSCHKSQTHLYSSLYLKFDAVALSNCFTQQQTGRGVCACVSERLKVCVYYPPLPPPAAPRNNCPERSLCLVMACCYLPPCCAEKEMTFQRYGFPWLLKPDSAAMNGASSTALDIQANLYFH